MSKSKAKVELKVKKREDLGKKNKKIRAQGLIPAVVYGRKFKATSISVDAKEFKKKVLSSEAGHNLLFTIKVTDDGKAQSIPVITQTIQRNPMTDAIIHLDLKHVVMDEAIKTQVPVELLGTPIGVKEEGGVLVHGLREVEIKCLPGDIPDKFEVNVLELAINTSLHVSDLKIDKKIEILSDPTELLAQVTPPTKEEEVAPALTPEEALAAGEVVEGAEAVAEEAVKEKTAPGAAPAEKEKAAPAPAEAEKKEKK